jgi:hypothetical protein
VEAIMADMLVVERVITQVLLGQELQLLAVETHQ